MLKLSSFQVQAVSLDLLQISWAIEATDESLSNYRFTVGRSNSPGGPFEAVSDELVNIFEFLDPTRQRRSNWRKIYYRLTVRDVTTAQAVESQVASLDSAPDFFLLEIRRRNDLYLKRFVGVPAGIFIRKTFGQRCQACWDQIKQRVRSSSCLTCYSVGFTGGYFPQVNTFANWNPSPELVAILDLGEGQPNGTNLWLSHYPLLSPADMIVEFPSQRRWRVVTVGKTERLRVTSRQVVQVKEISRSDVEYHVPVDVFESPADTFIGFRPKAGSALL